MNVDWYDQAACKGVDLDVFFPSDDTGRDYEQARSYCNRCPVRMQCIEYALDTGSEGIWGGVNINRQTRLSRDVMLEIARSGIGHGEKAGTIAGYYRESRARVPHCDACRAAYNEHQAAKRLASVR